MEKSYVKWMLVLVGLTLILHVPLASAQAAPPDSTWEAGNDAVMLSGEYVFDTESGSGVLKVYGPTPSDEIVFSLVMTTGDGCVIERSGRAQLVEKNKALYNQVNTNCKLEMNFNGSAVEIIQNDCPERHAFSCTFNGVYNLSFVHRDQ